ncbi:hexitol phosphatase HxpB [Myroides sp. 1354]|uniref:hexitol phosphatase HxpB n=1 Tax=unclassified Myroides TaxID=2642485 RepID=UPI0025772008|nr:MULTISPECIES: hexitol phosphatase HxpB [unclassified Myroides]MDM1043269.1 hexitol phosphatase HxpB [Myroides sp. R163-1]MDM1054678.1 hexitol phosphatase HxpB [Myroides sp. 1354]MDM1067975.1 hexitol phosphatase HxpB [Myroides sp. 1372]
MITTVLFDMDGVLIDSEKFWQQAEKEVFTSVGCQWSEEIAHQTTGQTTRAVTELWYHLFPWSGKTLEEVEQAVIDRVDELIRLEGEIKTGVLATLTFLQTQGIKIGLATNSTPSLIQTVLARLQIGHFFQTTVSALDVQQGKPAPDVYLQAARNLASQPENCLVVEDSFTGATAGKKAGMTVFIVPELEFYHDPKFNLADRKLVNLEEFEENFLALNCVTP